MNPTKVYNDTLALSPCPYPGVLLEFRGLTDGTYVVAVYKDNLSSFPTHKQQEITNWLHNFVAKMTSRGVPTQYWLAI